MARLELQYIRFPCVASLLAAYFKATQFVATIYSKLTMSVTLRDGCADFSGYWPGDRDARGWLLVDYEECTREGTRYNFRDAPSKSDVQSILALHSDPLVDALKERCVLSNFDAAGWLPGSWSQARDGNTFDDVPLDVLNATSHR